MPTVKDNLMQRLAATEEQRASAAVDNTDRLEEQAYWLEQALRDDNPYHILERAYALYKETNGERGLEPLDPNRDTAAGTSGMDRFEVPVKKGTTIWGMLREQFSSGEGLDDKRVAEVFNKLQPGAQAHFIDAVENDMRAMIEDEMQEYRKDSGIKTTIFGITDVDHIEPGQKINLGPLLKDEEKLLRLVEKARDIGPEKEAIIQKNNGKIAEWMKYHQSGELFTEERVDVILRGPKRSPENIITPDTKEETTFLVEKAEKGNALMPEEEETITDSLLPYEKRIRERLVVTPSEYVRLRTISVGELLDAVPVDPEKLQAIAGSAVKPTALTVGESEFWKRVRVAEHIRTYTLGKEIRNMTIRQFFRGLVERT